MTVHRAERSEALKRGVFLLGFLLPLCISISVVLASFSGGLLSFRTFIALLLILPIFEILLGRTKTVIDTPSWVRHLPLIQPPIQLAVMLWLCHWISLPERTITELIGITLSAGMMTGAAGIVAAHELIHRRSRLERGLGEFLLMFNGYMFFAIEHVDGHHVRVATPQDPVTAQRGESLYRFWPRAVIGSFKSAWRLELRRLERANLRRFGFNNRMLWYIVLPLATWTMLTVIFGWWAGIMLVGQGLLGVLLLEAIEYLEHYGLQRREVAPGRYETFSPRHSWDSDVLITNWFLYNLQRHSDHHLHAARRFPALRLHEEAPLLPTGYAGSLLLALIPPLWRRVIHPRLDGSPKPQADC